MDPTSPDHWFIGGAPVSSGNLVQPLIDGEAYFSHLYRCLSALGPGDSVRMAGWRFTPSFHLVPGDTDSRLACLIGRLVDRDVTVQALVWRAPGTFLRRANPSVHVRDSVRFAAAVNGLSGSGARAILSSHPSLRRLGAHHQKIVLVTSSGETVAYTGGMDICVDRWDTPRHDGDAGPDTEAFPALHDVHALVRGPAVADIESVFDRCWAAAVGEPVGPANRGETSDGRPGDHHVQVLRTVSPGACGSPSARGTPGGEQTILAAYRKAIDAAEHYVYVEDQYFWHSPLVSHLAGAARRGVAIILVQVDEPFGGLLRPFDRDLRHRTVAEIASAAPENLFVYHLSQTGERADIYVHAKLMIIDDRYAAIGSANMTARSMNQDTELAIAIVGGDVVAGRIAGRRVDVCRFARDLRVALWAEHLGLSDEAEVADPIDPATGRPSGWPTGGRGSDRRHHAVVHRAKPGSARFLHWAYGPLMNPDPPA